VIRAWLEAQTIPSHDAPFEDLRAWNAELFDAGWAAPSWPSEFGGRDASLEEQLDYNEAMAGVPGPVNAIGVANIAPAIMTYGTAEQKQRFLRPMLRGDAIWCQGMSEPEAGSDLASLRCSAVADGDDFVVSGQKTWNSNGHFADWCQLYVRTDTEVPKHKGITCLLVDMTTPGIDARPITTMAGDHSFAELFLTDVRVPRAAVLGEVNDGWSVATRTLSNERAGVASLYLTQRRTFERLRGAVPSLNAVGRDQLAQRYIEVRNLEFLAKRMIGAALAGKEPGAEGSVVKLAWSQCAQRLMNTAVDLTGDLNGSWGTSMLSSRSLTIAGGTTEVNKNIIGERVLGLPREPSV
jgi:alkylation response protein AidB-like acyl-CoA dehydrogenase